MRVVAICQRRLIDALSTTGALSDVLPGHLHMDPAKPAALGPVHSKAFAQLGDDALERPRLVSRCRCLCIAVHRIARPDDTAAFASHGPYQLRQSRPDTVGTHASD